MTPKKHLLLFSIIIMAIAAIPILLKINGSVDSVGILTIEPDTGSRLYIKNNNLDIIGMDKDGTTYFCLPAFVELDRIDQLESPIKVRLTDGETLINPEIGVKQSVLVDAGTDGEVPWNICFLRSKNLYSIFLSTNGAGMSEITHDSYSDISMSVFSPTGIMTYADRSALIKGRGNDTWGAEKKPYELKLSRDIPICGLSSSKKWCLLANYYEGTKILNKMVLDTAMQIGMDNVTDSDWVDLYADGIYLGNYLLCKEPAIGIDSPGNYLIEKNDIYYEKKKYGFRTPNDAFTIKSPNILSDDQINYIKDFTCGVDEAIHDGKVSPFGHIDMPSFEKWYMLEETFFNVDALVTSCYFYKKANEDMLYAGPPWDFDCSCGEDADRTLDYKGTILDEPKFRKPIEWYALLYSNPDYRLMLRSDFEKNFDVFESLIEHGIDAYYDKISASIYMDRAIYGRKGYGAAAEYAIPGYYDSLYNNFRYTKFFLYNRVNYLSDIWDCKVKMPEMSFNDGSYHTLKFTYPDKTSVEMTVPDGAQLMPDELPEFDTNTYDRWIYAENEMSFSYYIPIYEDAELVLYGSENSD